MNTYTEPITRTYSIEEVLKEAKRFSEEYPTLDKKDYLPDGIVNECDNCVLARFWGYSVNEMSDHIDNFLDDEEAEYAAQWRYCIDTYGEPTAIDSKILETFITEFDLGYYPELVWRAM